ncbi:unnamed protein product [Paramecium octaurelia]|uniref:Transmembrane protein n=1 Tax=Paramecium octaurelia TaxID=43137 RepID=A0A8S1T5F0_PAROT|nr:unnamed protein product [Paramecium octaurelia]
MHLYHLIHQITFQQVYGYADGKQLLQYKFKCNGVSAFYQGFWSLFIGGWLASIMAHKALQNYRKQLIKVKIRKMNQVYFPVFFLSKQRSNLKPIQDTSNLKIDQLQVQIIQINLQLIDKRIRLSMDLLISRHQIAYCIIEELIYYLCF